MLSKCVAAQPNVVLLSEIDPLSKITLSKNDFSPFDLLHHIQVGVRPLPREAVEEVFVEYLKGVHKVLNKSGLYCVIRDHTHSHLCVGEDPSSRPTIRDVIRREVDTKSLVTVRHPIDSFLSLRKNGRVMFEPNTLEEYCIRYLSFLDEYSSEPIIKYEDFVAQPDQVAEQMTTILDLSMSPQRKTIVPSIELTGDSGRSGKKISPRGRRNVPVDLMKECESSEAFISLCSRLNYDPAVVHAQAT